jgi:hypothetical protein
VVDDRQRERYATIGQAFLAKVAQRLANLDAATLSPAELARWVDVALKLQEAGARGAPYDRAQRVAELLHPDWADEADTASIRDDP